MKQNIKCVKDFIIKSTPNKDNRVYNFESNLELEKILHENYRELNKHGINLLDKICDSIEMKEFPPKTNNYFIIENAIEGDKFEFQILKLINNNYPNNISKWRKIHNLDNEDENMFKRTIKIPLFLKQIEIILQIIFYFHEIKEIQLQMSGDQFKAERVHMDYGCPIEKDLMPYSVFVALEDETFLYIGEKENLQLIYLPKNSAIVFTADTYYAFAESIGKHCFRIFFPFSTKRNTITQHSQMYSNERFEENTIENQKEKQQQLIQTYLNFKTF